MLIRWHLAMDNQPRVCARGALHGEDGAAPRPSTRCRQPSRLARALFSRSRLQLVKGILESAKYVGKTLLIQPPDAKLAAGCAADEPQARPWAPCCLCHRSQPGARPGNAAARGSSSTR